MTTFRPPPELVIDETEHWIINHREDSVLPGYLMVGSMAPAKNLSDLPEVAQAELGRHLAGMERILRELFSPSHLYIGRYGHMSGFSIHFHVIPVCHWVAEAFARDERYRVLRQFYAQQDDAFENDPGFDGAEMTLFVWREFCEGATSPAIQGPSVAETVRMIRERVSKASNPC